MIPDKNPETLEECLEILSKIKYESHGFPMFFMDYQCFEYGSFGGTWGCLYRNPAKFENPKIEEKTPKGACYKMLDFLREIQNGKKDIRINS
jgi:hypothetical protein